jgi:hypothetical protein
MSKKNTLLIAVAGIILVANIFPIKGEKLNCYVGMHNTELQPTERGVPFRYFHQTYLIGSCRSTANGKVYKTDNMGHRFELRNFLFDTSFAILILSIAWLLLKEKGVKK